MAENLSIRGIRVTIVELLGLNSTADPALTLLTFGSANLGGNKNEIIG